MEDLKKALTKVLKELYGVELEVTIERPDEQFGDASTNVAMQLAARLRRTPRDIATEISSQLKDLNFVIESSVAGPGFINIVFSDELLLAERVRYNELENLKIITEFSDPNPFKELHAGHLYTSIVGDAVSRLFERAGAAVHRVNFGGDVGMHVAKAIWGINNKIGGELPEKLSEIAEADRAGWLASCYVAGSQAYDNDEAAKNEIKVLNKKVYSIVSEQDYDSAIAQIYWTCRQWSYDYFDAFYERIGVQFERYIPESEVAPLGLEAVKDQLAGGIFKESDGAVIFDGDAIGLHTRVFINREGLPTYEAKDVGLALTKWQDYKFDLSFIMTGSEQAEYMKVVLAALSRFVPEVSSRTEHVTHGIVKMVGGVRMSSRKGGNLLAVDVLESAEAAAKEINKTAASVVGLGSAKYAFLKHRIGGDIIFDPVESVSLQGNSGAYIQYAHARACSIIEKSDIKALKPTKLENLERRLARKCSEFEDVIAKATIERMPHYICSYLYELAQTFNGFYERCRVVGGAREAERLWLVNEYAQILKQGLEVLGISAPSRL